MHEEEEWEEFEKATLVFSAAANEACKEWDKNYRFTCPLCGGLARARKTSKPKGLGARCEHCGLTLMN